MVDTNFVSSVFVLRNIINNPNHYDSKLDEILAIPLGNKLSYGRLPQFEWTFNDVFVNSTVWQEAELSPGENIVNRIYNTLLNRKNQKGRELVDLIEDYKNNLLLEKDARIINNIRQRLKLDPRIIVLTKDLTEFAIYDGWHTAIAFALEDREIPAYVGLRDSFLCYP